jgi:hypothetical protein
MWPSRGCYRYPQTHSGWGNNWGRMLKRKSVNPKRTGTHPNRYRLQIIQRGSRWIVWDTGSGKQIAGPFIMGREAREQLRVLKSISRQRAKRQKPRRNVVPIFGIPNPKGLVKIYGQVLRIEAKKTGAHRCDSKCKKVGHRYYHVFKTKPKMYGTPDRKTLIIQS